MNNNKKVLKYILLKNSLLIINIMNIIYSKKKYLINRFCFVSIIQSEYYSEYLFIKCIQDGRESLVGINNS